MDARIIPQRLKCLIYVLSGLFLSKNLCSPRGTLCHRGCTICHGPIACCATPHGTACHITRTKEPDLHGTDIHSFYLFLRVMDRKNIRSPPSVHLLVVFLFIKAAAHGGGCQIRKNTSPNTKNIKPVRHVRRAPDRKH